MSWNIYIFVTKYAYTNFSLFLIVQDGFKAFEEKVCVKKFPHADQPGFDVAETTIDVLLELTR